ncbi:MAG: DNA topoisomerase 4 subunit A [Christensenellaceae bacterium]|jgi:DNA gyrase subunit A|nr:DNA topoisomerase 4 subunit A [Christensenellaceae bacterium]
MARNKATNIHDENFKENIIERSLEKVLPDAMMPYSEHIILDRALPRVEDGLKPVQRRILYSMHEMHMRPDTPYKKSAKVVGDCLGKYHPHGDTSIYDAMVRMAQDFNMRVTLVDGHGNFGSIDGDSAAAMRYTEVRLTKLSIELLRDIDKDTVEWNKNFDDTLEEPGILPGRFPNLLVNGASGIAIGLATNIPPHNLGEVIDGCVAMIDNQEITMEEMIAYVKGPDFPTGAYMLVDENIIEMYKTGRGKVRQRAKAAIEHGENGRRDIVITEIPYGVNKEALQKRIFDLKETQKETLGGIIDVVDESDRSGMRVVVKIKKGENSEKILEVLYQKTDLECNFNVNIVAIADGKPKQLGLLEILRYYLEYQRKIVYRRSIHDVNIAQKRAHILEGFKKIFPDIDEVIRIIRRSPTRADAKVGLIERFELTQEQAEAILTLQLGNINKMDIDKFDKELKELGSSIRRLSKIIRDEKEQMNVVKNELLEIKERFPSPRLTTIVGALSETDAAQRDFNPTVRTSKSGIVAIDQNGGVKFMTRRSYLVGSRDLTGGGLNSLAATLVKIEPEHTSLIFGSKGNCYKPDFEKFPEKKWSDGGMALKKLFLDAVNEEKAVSIIAFNEAESAGKKVYLYTKMGLVICIRLKQCVVNKEVCELVSIKDDDEIIGAEIAESDSTVFFVTTDGLALNTLTDEYAPHNRGTSGIVGIKLNDNERVVYAGQAFINGDTEEFIGEIAIISNKGYVKKVMVDEFEPLQRARKGMKIIDLKEDESVVFAEKIIEPCELGIITENNELQVLETDHMRSEKRESKGRPVLYGIKIQKVVCHHGELT